MDEAAGLSRPTCADAVHAEGAPAFAFARTASEDADEAAQRLREWDQTYHQLTPGRFRGLTTDLWLGSLQVFRERSNRRIYQAGRAWPGSVTFGVPLAMDGPARFCGEILDLDSVLVLGPHGELDFQTSLELDILGITMPQALLRTLDERISDSALGSPALGSGLIRLDGASAARLRTLGRSLFAALEADPARLLVRGLREQVRDTVLDTLARSLLSVVLRRLDADRHVNQRALVEWVRELALRERCDSPLTVEQLSARLGVSRRTLQYAFASVLGTSPVQFLRAARLQGVRRELKKTPRSAASIQDIAARWGFWHLGHFSANYRELFGCLPSETPRPEGL